MKRVAEVRILDHKLAASVPNANSVSSSSLCNRSTQIANKLPRTFSLRTFSPNALQILSSPLSSFQLHFKPAKLAHEIHNRFSPLSSLLSLLYTHTIGTLTQSPKRSLRTLNSNSLNNRSKCQSLVVCFESPVRTPTNVVGSHRVSLASVDGGIKTVLKDNPHPRNTVELLRYDVQFTPIKRSRASARSDTRQRD